MAIAAEIIVMLGSFLGLFFVIRNARRRHMRLFGIGYALSVVLAVTTVVDHFLLPGLMSLIGLVVGIMGSGLFFAVVARNSRQRILRLSMMAEKFGERSR